MIGYKKIEVYNGDISCSAIATLLIYDDSKKCNPLNGSKWRCDRAKVLNIESYGGSIEYTHGRSLFAPYLGVTGVMYYVGQDVTPENGFDDNDLLEYGKGIHYFLTKQEAIDFRI